VYRVSPRRLSDVEPYKYPYGYLLRRVDRGGFIAVAGKSVYLSDALIWTEVGLERLDETHWRVWFCDMAIKEICVERAVPRWLAPPAITQV